MTIIQQVIIAGVKCECCSRTVLRVQDGVIEVRMRHDSAWHVTKIAVADLLEKGETIAAA